MAVAQRANTAAGVELAAVPTPEPSSPAALIRAPWCLACGEIVDEWDVCPKAGTPGHADEDGNVLR